MLNEEVKARRNNTSHSGPVKSLFLTLCSDDEVFSVVSLLDNKKATRKIAVNTKFSNTVKQYCAVFMQALRCMSNARSVSQML